MIYFGIAVHSFKASLSHESKVLLIDSFENMIGNLLTVGVFVWCYDEVFKHHINGASTQTKAIALQWEYHKIPNCYLGNQVIITDNSLGTCPTYRLHAARQSSPCSCPLPYTIMVAALLLPC